MTRLGEGARFDRYEVVDVLGEGGVAVVYLVRHRQLGTLRALKVPTDSRASTRLELEAVVQASLEHENIVDVIDLLSVDGTIAVLMEYVPPPTLAGFVLTRPDPVLGEMLFRGIVGGVAHAHSKGFVHRDLKPSNVLLAQTGRGWVPKLSDFGIVKTAVDNGNARTGNAMGTPQYMAPEQFEDAKHVDNRADIFSLGCVFYEILTGTPAFAFGSTVTIYQKVRTRGYTPLPAAVPDRIRDVIDGCLEPSSSWRIPDCATILEHLGPLEQVARPHRVTSQQAARTSGAPDYGGAVAPAIVRAFASGLPGALVEATLAEAWRKNLSESETAARLDALAATPR